MLNRQQMVLLIILEEMWLHPSVENQDPVTPCRGVSGNVCSGLCFVFLRLWNHCLLTVLAEIDLVGRFLYMNVCMCTNVLLCHLILYGFLKLFLHLYVCCNFLI